MSFRRVFSHRNFALNWVSRTLKMTANMALGIILGWQVYNLARQTLSIEESSFLVGMIGLAQFLPIFLLALPAGETADRYDKRRIMIIGTVAQVMCALLLVWISMMPGVRFMPFFVVSALFGVVRSFLNPASSALLSYLVPREVIPHAVVWNQLSIQAGIIIGPTIGGALCAISMPLAYGVVAGMFSVDLCMLWMIAADTRPMHEVGNRMQMIKEGLHYLWTNKVVLGAISLDFTAVFFGGVTALLPVFARDFLDVGPHGFGLLRAAMGIGGCSTMLLLSVRPVRRHAGVWMMGAVVVFGLATLVFGVSHSLTLSLIALTVMGMADAISVFVRQSLIQITIPDYIRGRVSAVSGLFISASNELGEFESGTASRIMGPIMATLFGGVGSIIVTGLWAKIFPALRKTDKIEAPDY